ncbi:hypothetical protein K402DRAFT_456026 [Aulographum hederae CBS 113979]|uniref:Uncharacterized protein n=1 Tax=Aulographum hederae CBS 113979 TaxID=1176131 RepID=A0A6G1GTN3_9PEZI|nr:hypothetical protein K402DRAFT_456026 [Aulographum hederae CBS 113979]
MHINPPTSGTSVSIIQAQQPHPASKALLYKPLIPAHSSQTTLHSSTHSLPLSLNTSNMWSKNFSVAFLALLSITTVTASPTPQSEAAPPAAGGGGKGPDLAAIMGLLGALAGMAKGKGGSPSAGEGMGGMGGTSGGSESGHSHGGKKKKGRLSGLGGHDHGALVF